MNAPDESPDESKPARAPWLTRFGCTVGVAMLASLVASAPSALRFSAAADLDLARAWLTTAGLLIAPMLVLVPLARLARESLRGFASTTGNLERVSAATFFVCTWLWIAQTLGAVLRAKTHQRALAGVAFAVAVVVAFVFLAFVARRLARILSTLRARDHRLVRALGTFAAVAVAVLAFGLLALRIVHAAPALDDASRATLVDGVASALSLAFFARSAFDDQRILTRLGPPVAVLALVVSMHTLATHLQATRALEQACPVHFAVLKGFAALAF